MDLDTLNINIEVMMAATKPPSIRKAMLAFYSPLYSLRHSYEKLSWLRLKAHLELTQRSVNTKLNGTSKMALEPIWKAYM